MENTSKKLANINRSLVNGVVVDDALWFVDVYYTYLCRFDLREERVTYTVKIPECPIIQKMGYRRIERYGDFTLVLVPNIMGEAEVVLFDMKERTFEICSPYAQNILNRQRHYICTNAVVDDNKMFMYGVVDIAEAAVPVVLAFDLENRAFFLDKSWDTILNKYKGKGVDFGHRMCRYGHKDVILVVGTNALVMIDRETGQMSDCVAEGVAEITQCFVCGGNLYITDDKQRILSMREDGTFTEQVLTDKDFSVYHWVFPMCDKVAFCSYRKPVVDLWDTHTFRTVEFKDHSLHRADPVHPPGFRPIAVWNDYVFLFSLYDNRLYVVDTEFRIVKDMEIWTDFGLSEEEFERELRKYIDRESKHGILEEEVPGASLSRFIESVAAPVES